MKGDGSSRPAIHHFSSLITHPSSHARIEASWRLFRQGESQKKKGQGDGETRRQGNKANTVSDLISLSPSLLVSVSVSDFLPIPKAPRIAGKNRVFRHPAGA